MATQTVPNASSPTWATRLYRNFYWKLVNPARESLMVLAGTRRIPDGRRLLRTIQPYTMVGLPRLLNAIEVTRLIDERRLLGSIVECGVFKGGCAGLMAKVSTYGGSGRRTWLFDSFEGLPEPTAADGEMAATYADQRSKGRLESIDRCVGPLATARELLFSRLQLNEESIVIRKGWFQETLPAARQELGDIALLRLDGDWYESTKVCLENLYDLVVPGGFVIIDDYGYWEGCRRATDEFLSDRRINVSLIWVDDSGVYFQKP